MEYKDISCDICQDLIPLVHDNVASKDSTDLVKEHIKTCDLCRTMYEHREGYPLSETHDRDNINRIKKKLVFVGLFMLTAGAFLGVFLSDSMGMFNNFIIMPTVGAVGYYTLKSRWYLCLSGVFSLSLLWLFIGKTLEIHKFAMESVIMAFYLSGIYTFLVLIGAIIGMLLHFAFKKE
ncbi:zf-HC2 domain-containing protein [Anaerocolumna sp. AGMB13025]|uniref:zf-HC2 domain-containing protein n=1 Tax=Anaerocolumna sp. AGMB13025 TaxID=3039116 RepID=UPI00241E1F54|nr:zf-HC2 domain-containing protein [Anaerocolumna sp. AGMB13025]WFR56482.1 zf-HC2 domain-containing protein [Anaerocolumna sp. AGMB13025]